MRTEIRTLSLIVLLFIVRMAFTTNAYTQSIFTGELTGTVFDPSGAVVAGAHVELRSEATAESLAATTDVLGHFRFALLRPADYTLTVAVRGFVAKSEHVT